MLRHRGGVRGGRGKGTHQQSADDGEEQPAHQGQDGAGPGGVVRQVAVALAVVAGHQGVDADISAHGNGGDDQLDRVDDGEGGQSVAGEFAYEIAVHDVVHGLDQLGQHHWRRDPQQDGPDTFRIKKAV